MMLTNKKYIFAAALICIVTVLLLTRTQMAHLVLNGKFGETDFDFSRGKVKSFERHVRAKLDLRRKRDYAMRNVDCEGVIKGNKQSLENAKKEFTSYVSNKDSKYKNESLIYSDRTVSKWAENCTEFVTSRKYITSPINSEEAEYPIAYIISLYTDLQSFENLLRAIYRPQNIYCIHVDQKSPAEFQTAVTSIIDCFDNVFLATHLTKVWYTHWTIVQASLNCMEDLVKLKEKYPWKYALNLCGQDLPSKTNLEIVKGLKRLGGHNSVQSEKVTDKNPRKTRHDFVHVHNMNIRMGTHDGMKNTGKKKEPPPYNIQLFEGADYFIFTRSAVEYMLTDPKIRDFFEWCKDTMIPDEIVWATMHRMYPQFPGSEPPEENISNKYFGRSRIWYSKSNTKCDGLFVRTLCVFGLGELNWIAEQKEFFANKFSPNVNIFAINCLLEWHHNKTLLEYENNYLQ